MAEKKSFKPTRKRLEEARKEGKVLKSQDLSQATGMMSAAACICLGLHFGWVNLVLLVKYSFTLGFEHPVVLLLLWMKAFVSAVLLIVGGAALASAVAERIQAGSMFYLKLALPDFSRLNPASGIKKIFSGFKQIWLAAFKFTLLAAIMSGAGCALWQDLAGASLRGISETGMYEALRIVPVFVVCGLAGLLICGVVDYMFKRKTYFRELSMSLDEVKREHKDQEGDPLMKAARRSAHEMLLLQNLEKKVRKARVIVVERS